MLSAIAITKTRTSIPFGIIIFGIADEFCDRVVEPKMLVDRAVVFCDCIVEPNELLDRVIILCG